MHELETKKHIELSNAREFITSILAECEKLPKDSILISSSTTTETLEEYEKACGTILTELQKWTSYPGFVEAFREGLVLDEHISNCYKHRYLPFSTIEESEIDAKGVGDIIVKFLDDVEKRKSLCWAVKREAELRAIEQTRKEQEAKRRKAEQSKAAAAPRISTSASEIMPMSYMGKPIAYHYEKVKVVILSGQEPDFKSLNPGDIVQFAQEQTNSHDKNAVVVESGSRKLGYLYKGKMQDMVNDFINKDDAILSHIDSIDDDNGKITVYIAFYRKKL
ncbi:MAG: hypothetical protein LBJ99_01310 [Oscillospiraceae bacterium]|nr:hypothetical protein [Oscillospiraceae bacterium]